MCVHWVDVLPQFLAHNLWRSSDGLAHSAQSLHELPFTHGSGVSHNWISFCCSGRWGGESGEREVRVVGEEEGRGRKRKEEEGKGERLKT